MGSADPAFRGSWRMRTIPRNIPFGIGVASGIEFPADLELPHCCRLPDGVNLDPDSDSDADSETDGGADSPCCAGKTKPAPSRRGRSADEMGWLSSGVQRPAGIPGQDHPA